jgi:hypothetical protein
MTSAAHSITGFLLAVFFSSFFAAIGFHTDLREILSGALAPSR